MKRFAFAFVLLLVASVPAFAADYVLYPWATASDPFAGAVATADPVVVPMAARRWVQICGPNGCRLVEYKPMPMGDTIPAGYHRMPDGSLMQDVDMPGVSYVSYGMTDDVGMTYRTRRVGPIRRLLQRFRR